MIFLIVVLLLMVVGLVYQAAASRRDNEKYPAPGQLVQTKNGEVHVRVQGDGDVTVVFEAGQGDSSLEWAAVESGVAKFTGCCVYDRAGIGWSSAARGVQRPEEIADKLHQALHGAGINGPYLLVGHSVGGIYVRAFAQRYGEEVFGLLFVDSAHENQRFRLPSDAFGEERILKGFAAVFRLLAPFGVARVLRLADRIQGANFSDDVRPAAMARMYQTHFFRALFNEVKTAELSTAQKEPPESLGDVPLIVLSRGGENPGLPEAQFEALKQGWDVLQKELVGLSTNGRQIIAQDSGHYIHHDQPELVVEAVREMVRPGTDGGNQKTINSKP